MAKCNLCESAGAKKTCIECGEFTCSSCCHEIQKKIICESCADDMVEAYIEDNYADILEEILEEKTNKGA